MMGHRLEELAMRRQMLLLRSERLRAELAAEQRYVLQALSGFDRYLSIARGLAKPALLGGVGLLLLRFVRRGRRAAGLPTRVLGWVSLARRLLPFIGLVRAYLHSRSRRHSPESP